MNKVSRRKALLGAAGALALAGGSRIAFAALAKRESLALRTRGGVAFGTTVALTVAGQDPLHLDAALDAAFVGIRAVENASSVYRPDSDVSRLNRDGRVDRPSTHLLTLLRYCSSLSKETDGRFDVTVQPLWDLWASSTARGHRPTPADLAPVLERINWRAVRIEDDSVSLDRPGMAVTLNSVNQGYAADVVMDILARHGIAHALVDTGEYGARGKHPEGRDWRLGVVDPRATDQLAFTLDPFRRFAATSGDYKTYFSPDFRDHHIFDPGSGYSPTDWSSITVEAPSGLIADGVATALFAMNQDEARGYMDRHPECRARVFGKDGGDRGDLSLSA